MHFGRRRVHQHTTTTTASAPRRKGLFSRRPRQQKRKPSVKDKISGVLTKLRGRLTHRSGVKAAGTRRMRGTDGRTTHRTKRRFF